MGDATAALCEVFEMPVKKSLVGDCKAALAQLVGDTGPWRIRHLRLRSSKLREALRGESPEWTAEHRSGTELAADGLTKALQGQAFRKFVGLLRMMSPDMSEGDSQPKVASLRTGVCSHPAVGACLLAGVALMEQAPVVASLVIVAALIFGMVEGKVKQDPP